MNTESGRRCVPPASKLSGASQASNAALRAGHSASVIENHVVSRLRCLYTMACRNNPSKVKPNRNAAWREGAFRLSHFHS